MAVAAMQDADRHIRSSLGFSILPKDALRCRQGESNQRPSLNKLLALPLSHNRPPFFASGGRFFNLRRSGHWTQMCKAPTAYRLQQKTNRIRLPFTSLIGPRCHAPSFSVLLVSGRTTEGDARTWFLVSGHAGCLLDHQQWWLSMLALSTDLISTADTVQNSSGMYKVRAVDGVNVVSLAYCRFLIFWSIWWSFVMLLTALVRSLKPVWTNGVVSAVFLTPKYW